MTGLAWTVGWLTAGAMLGLVTDYAASRWWVKHDVYVVDWALVIGGALLGPFAVLGLPVAMFIHWSVEALIRAEDAVDRRRNAKRIRRG